MSLLKITSLLFIVIFILMILLRIYNFCVDIILLFLTLHYIIDKRLKMNNLTFFD
jgi:hypothetical protein